MRKNKILVVTVSQGKRSSILRTISSVAKINQGDIDHYVVVPQDQITAFQEDDHTFFVPQPEPDRGLYPTLNHIIKERCAQYQWVTYLNDDDFWFSNFRKLIDTVVGQELFDGIYANVSFVDIHGEKIGDQTSSPRYRAFKYLYQADIVLFTQQATLVRTSVFKKLDGFDENYQLIADTDFWIRAIDSDVKFKYLDLACAAYARHRYQLSNNQPLLEEEKKRLFHRMGNLNWARVYFEKVLFRFYNLKIYFRRLMLFGRIELLQIIKRSDTDEVE